MPGPEEDIVSMHKRRKRWDNNDLLQTVTSIMKEPIKIEASSLLKEDTIPASGPVQSAPVQSVPVQDNISHLMTLIENLLREFPRNEGFSYGLQLLQLVSEKAEQLRKKLN